MSDQKQQNIELVKKGYEPSSAGDVEAVMSLFDDNIEWVQPGDSAISGTYQGKAELGADLSRLAEKPVTVKLKSRIADGDTRRDRKTVRVQVHTDTAIMERVYGRKKIATV